MSTVRLKVRIHGRVQGVFFRQSTKEMATQLGLTGWVRNCPDGSVEAIFEGKKETAEDALEWCRKGPSAAHVTKLEPVWSVSQNAFSGFEVRR